MRFRALEELERLRLLERKPADLDLVAGWLERSREDLEVASQVLGADHRARAVAVAYEAGYRVCAGLVALEGYRVRSVPGHHRAAIEAAGAAGNEDLLARLRRLDRARRFRNDSLYGEAPIPGEGDLEQLVVDVRGLIGMLERRLEEERHSEGSGP